MKCCHKHLAAPTHPHKDSFVNLVFLETQHNMSVPDLTVDIVLQILLLFLYLMTAEAGIILSVFCFHYFVIYYFVTDYLANMRQS